MQYSHEHEEIQRTLKRFIDENSGSLWVHEDHRRALQEIYRYPLRGTATNTLNRHLRSGISDQQLAELVYDLRADERLCVREREDGHDSHVRNEAHR